MMYSFKSRSNASGQMLLRCEAESPNSLSIVQCGHCQYVYAVEGDRFTTCKCPSCQSGETRIELPIERDGKPWSREEHLIAFGVYNRIPFGSIHMRNPEVIALAALLGRRVGSASMKLANFSRLDPYQKSRAIRGLENGAKGEAELWRDFEANPEAVVLEITIATASRMQTPLDELDQDIEKSPSIDETEKLSSIKIRLQQGFFRSRILSAYGSKCCVSGISHSALLVASHIVPWSVDKKNRLNPRNGLCLNALHDKAFDRGLMWLESDYRIAFSEQITAGAGSRFGNIDWLTSFTGKRIDVTGGLEPDPELLARHADWCKTVRV